MIILSGNISWAGLRRTRPHDYPGPVLDEGRPHTRPPCRGGRLPGRHGPARRHAPPTCRHSGGAKCVHPAHVRGGTSGPRSPSTRMRTARSVRGKVPEGVLPTAPTALTGGARNPGGCLRPDAFVNALVLVVDTERGVARRAGPAHETSLSGWGPLADALVELDLHDAERRRRVPRPSLARPARRPGMDDGRTRRDRSAQTSWHPSRQPSG